ncbi:MAG: PAS and helix-turn-helix domain-containing protein [Desulfobacterales bacterium]|nr:PAS and helix-turn-helix domain-containing protein [Desulfobacterales bacterium]
MGKRQDRTTALAASEDRYRESRFQTLVETMGDGLSEINEHQETTYANLTLCRMWRRDLSDILGVPVSRFLDDENRAVLNAQMEKRRQGESTPYELTWTCGDGALLPTLMTPTPYFDDQGEFKGSFAVVTDISFHCHEKNSLTREVDRRTRELEKKNQSLEELNTTLKVLFKKREQDRKRMENQMTVNIKELILPCLERLGNGNLDSAQRLCLRTAEAHLNEITSPFIHRLSIAFRQLTPSEIQVANLVRHGRSSKEIARTLGISRETVGSYRKQIRRKLGITRRGINLRSHLSRLF